LLKPKTSVEINSNYTWGPYGRL